MPSQIKVGGTWRNVTMPYTKVAGVWKPAKAGYTKVAGVWRSWWLQGGINDASFATYDTQNLGLPIGITTLAEQSDGKLLVGGGFTSWNGVQVGYIVRLNTNGTRDTAFTTNTGTGANAAILTIALQSDGKILIGGNFTTWNGTTVNRIVRLNADGTRDTTFTTNVGTAANDSTIDIALQSDGKAVIVGAFTTWNGTTVGRIVRLNSDGTRDTAFTTANGTGANASLNQVAINASTGTIVVTSFLFFTAWNGTTVPYIARLTSTGALDTAFNTAIGTAGANASFYAAEVQSDGATLLGGAFTSWNGTANINRVVRLTSTGARDTTFSTNVGTGANDAVNAFRVLSGGQILVGGIFTSWNGTSLNGAVLLSSAGVRDTTFSTNAGTAAQVRTNVQLFLQRSSGRIIVGGYFATWNSSTVNGLVELETTGVRYTVNGIGTSQTGASSFIGNSGGGNGKAIVQQTDGKLVVVGNFNRWQSTAAGRIARLNTNGTLDTAFTTNNGTGANDGVICVALQSDGKIIIGGSFTTWNGTTVNRIVRLNADGTRDTAFTTNTGTAASGVVQTAALQADGKILVGGIFTTWNGVTVNNIVRLNTDGTRDTAFTTSVGTATNGGVTGVTVQSDGQILVYGGFSTWNAVAVTNIVRLSSAGARDTTFSTNVGTTTGSQFTPINLVSQTSAGNIIICGGFTAWNGTAGVNGIVQLTSTGTRNTAFTTNTGTAATNFTAITALTIQPDGRILVGGNFTTWNGVTVNRIVRLGSTGIREAAFTSNTGTGFSWQVNSIATISNDRLAIGGNFGSFNGTNRSYLAVIGSGTAL